VAVAEELSFARAADRLHISQPPLSTQIRDLEVELGTRLLERTKRIVRMTPAGRVFLEEARAILEQIDGARKRVRSVTQGKGGSVRIGVIPTAALPAIAQGVQRFLRRHQNVEVLIREGDVDSLLAEIDQDRLDVAFVRPLGTMPHLKTQTVYRDKLVLVVPDSHRLAGVKSVGWECLNGERVLLIRNNHNFGLALRHACAAHGARPFFLHVAEDFHSLLWLVSAGLGICPAPASVVGQLPPGSVVRPLAKGAPPLDVVAVWRKDQAHPLVARLLGMLAPHRRS
jgi:DNA-binding transcriptional LysR family regulator